MVGGTVSRSGSIRATPRARWWISLAAISCQCELPDLDYQVKEFTLDVLGATAAHA